MRGRTARICSEAGLKQVQGDLKTEGKKGQSAEIKGKKWNYLEKLLSNSRQWKQMEQYRVRGIIII